MAFVELGPEQRQDAGEAISIRLKFPPHLMPEAAEPHTHGWPELLGTSLPEDDSFG
jgi:hypothetical protein